MELQRNGVDMSEQIFRREMNKIINEHGQLYEELAERMGGEDDLMDVFHRMNINSFGRAIAFSALLYYKRRSGVDICRSIRLVSNVLKLNFRNKRMWWNITKKSLWERLIPYIGQVIVLIVTHEFVKKF